MSNWVFGMAMLVAGMGGTLISLYVLGIMVRLLKMAFPLKKEAKSTEAA